LTIISKILLWIFLGYNIDILVILVKDRMMEIKKCSTLAEARNEIDSVDRGIVELIAKRNEYIKQIAHFKTSVEEVKAEDRIADVIAHVREQAISLGLSPNLINDLYVRMIDEMVESEISEFKNAQRY
jgi:isochorismate pyruvate lyase